jgi:hypothetical protein
VVLRIGMLLAFSDAVVAPFSQRFLDASTPDAVGAHLGYPAGVLEPLHHLGHWSVILVVLQHVAGLLTATAVYVLLRRWDVWPWLAALSTVPLLLGPHLVMSEQLVAPDAFVTLAVALVALVVGWRARPHALACVLAGLCVGAVATMSPAGAVATVVVAAVVLAAGHGLRGRALGIVALLLGFGVALAAYAGWQHCRGPYDAGHLASTAGVHGWSSVSGGPAADLVGTDAAGRSDAAISTYEDEPGLDAPIHALASYGDAVGMPLWPLLAGPLLGLVALCGVGRARAARMGLVLLLTGLLPVTVVLGALLVDAASWHDVTPAVALWPATGALALTALLRGRRSASAERPQLDDVDRAAVADFDERYGAPQLARVAVVIAAYNEGPGLPKVLDALPDQVCGIDADVVVVDDGSSDDTSDATLAHPRAMLVRCRTNRGQGAALRLGYRIAREHGAEFVITTDADGQYDTADFPTVLRPVLDGRADFVTGSRRLGHQHTFDRFRRLGVHVFAWIVSAMVGQRMTDTSFGLRAMRADLTARVTLNQPQYQSSELLIGTFSHGYRVLEVPGTMHLRSAGSTKKGRNLVYGRRYAGVVFGTWWREGCPRPVHEGARALRIGNRL